MKEHLFPSTLATLIEKIVVDIVPEELTPYKLTGPQIIAKVLDGHDPRRSTSHRFGNEFGGEVGEWATYIQIIIATASLLVQCVQARRSKITIQDLTETWTKELKSAGLKHDIAESIPRKFASELRLTIHLATKQSADD